MIRNRVLDIEDMYTKTFMNVDLLVIYLVWPHQYELVQAMG